MKSFKKFMALIFTLVILFPSFGGVRAEIFTVTEELRQSIRGSVIGSNTVVARGGSSEAIVDVCEKRITYLKGMSSSHVDRRRVLELVRNYAAACRLGDATEIRLLSKSGPDLKINAGVLIGIYQDIRSEFSGKTGSGSVPCKSKKKKKQPLGRRQNRQDGTHNGMSRSYQKP